MTASAALGRGSSQERPLDGDVVSRSKLQADRTCPAARDLARRKMKTRAFFRSRNQRKKIETRFAHLKPHHRFERLRLRVLSGARDEFHLATILQNLKTMALRLLGLPIE